MNVPVTVNGVTVEIPVDDKVIQEALKKKQKKTGYERNINGSFYCGDSRREGVKASFDSHEVICDAFYEDANYYSNVVVAHNNIRADRLMRKLRRFAAEHGGAVAPFSNYGYSLYWNEVKGKLDYGNDRCVTTGTIRFKNAKAAMAAIAEFEDELIWYFTEYAPMPEGWWD